MLNCGPSDLQPFHRLTRSLILVLGSVALLAMGGCEAPKPDAHRTVAASGTSAPLIATEDPATSSGPSAISGGQKAHTHITFENPADVLQGLPQLRITTEQHGNSPIREQDRKPPRLPKPHRVAQGRPTGNPRSYEEAIERQRLVATRLDQLGVQIDQLAADLAKLLDSRTINAATVELVPLIVDELTSALIDEVVDRATDRVASQIEKRVLKRLSPRTANVLSRTAALSTAIGVVKTAWDILDIYVEYQHAEAEREQAKVIEILRTELRDQTPLRVEQAIDARASAEDARKTKLLQDATAAERQKLEQLLTQFERERASISVKENP